MHNWVADVVVVVFAVADLWIAFMYAMQRQVQCNECGAYSQEKEKWPRSK